MGAIMMVLVLTSSSVIKVVRLEVKSFEAARVGSATLKVIVILLALLLHLLREV